MTHADHGWPLMLLGLLIGMHLAARSWCARQVPAQAIPAALRRRIARITSAVPALAVISVGTVLGGAVMVAAGR